MIMANLSSKDNTDDDHGNSGTTALPIPPTHKLISTSNKLAVFRQLTGINSDPALKLAVNDKPAVSLQFTRPNKDSKDSKGSKDSKDSVLKLSSKEKLVVFLHLIGINNDPAPEPIGTDRPASNIGIYARATRAEGQAKLRYRRFSLLINACLGIQIIVAASLTALGAGNGPHRVVTGFGAINTIIAGFLTYLKGSGLPDRYKHQQDQWGRLIEYIEQRERDFCLDTCAFEVNEEIQIIECMYEDARSEQSSVPNSYGLSKAREKGGTKSQEKDDDLEQGAKRTGPTGSTNYGNI